MKSKEIYPQQTIENPPVLPEAEKSTEDAFKVLGIEKSVATEQSVRKKFHQEIKFAHPDKLIRRSSEKARKIIEAYKEVKKYLRTQWYLPKLRKFRKDADEKIFKEEYFSKFSKDLIEDCRAFVEQDSERLLKSYKKWLSEKEEDIDEYELEDPDFLVLEYFDMLSKRITKESSSPRQAGHALLAIGASYHKLGNFINEGMFFDKWSQDRIELELGKDATLTTRACTGEWPEENEEGFQVVIRKFEFYTDYLYGGFRWL